jgi:hypothetical protein
VRQVEAARPGRGDERSQKLSSQYRGASVIHDPAAGVARAGAFVTQGARKVTGLRGDFGVLQMVKVLEPALDGELRGDHARRKPKNVVDMFSRAAADSNERSTEWQGFTHVKITDVASVRRGPTSLGRRPGRSTGTSCT